MKVFIAILCLTCIITAVVGYFVPPAAIASLIYRTSLAALVARVAFVNEERRSS